jgi:hypothetical protein
MLSAVLMAPAAFLGSARQSLSELSSRNLIDAGLDSLLINNQLNPDIPWVLNLQQNWEIYAQNLSPSHTSPPVPQWSSNAFLSLQSSHLQHKLFHDLVKAAQATLINSVSPQDQIRIASCSATGAGAFIRATAHSQGALFSNQEFQVAIKLRLRAPLLLMCPSHCICGELLDDFGDHLLKCRIGGEWNYRHSAIVHLIASLCRSVQLTTQHEVPLQTLGPLSSLDPSGNGRMDLVVTSCDSPSFLADVTITHPSPSNQPISQQMLQPLYFAKSAEHRKRRKYGEVVRSMNQAFIPMALETFGALGPCLDKSLKEMATRIGRLNDWHHNTDIFYISTLMRFWRTRISTCLQKCNAKLIISKAHRVRSRSRQGSSPGPPNMSSDWIIR